MRRGLWFVAGAGAGVYLTVRARRMAEAFTPDGLRDRVAGLSLGAHLFGEEVRTGMAERETELRRRLGWALDGDRVLPRADHTAPELAPDAARHDRAATHSSDAERELT